jgi:hypothetical protein
MLYYYFFDSTNTIRITNLTGNSGGMMHVRQNQILYYKGTTLQSSLWIYPNANASFISHILFIFMLYIMFIFYIYTFDEPHPSSSLQASSSIFMEVYAGLKPYKYMVLSILKAQASHAT